MRKAVVVLLAVSLLAAIAVGWFVMRGPDLSSYEPLVEPRITTLPDQRVVQVEARGDPNAVGSDAFGLLFEAYFGIDGAPKGPEQKAPRARWPVDVESPADEWVGYYAMPIPESASQLPDLEVPDGLTLTIAEWEYGGVAEILHKGPYEAETPTIERLKDFIAESGYEIAGLHEEEYLRGPGMLLPVDPDDYYTIIRYQVRKAPSP